MIQITGTYDNGVVKIDEEIAVSKPVKVLVTFSDEDVLPQKKHLRFEDFSFLQSRELLKDVHTTISDALIEERRSEL